jgi:dTDP-glucose 4,6-dehydratase
MATAFSFSPEFSLDFFLLGTLNEKYFVTGGAGFIGSNFINYILEKRDDYNIVNLDKLTYAGNLENLKSSEEKKNYHFIKGDITNSELVKYIFGKFEIKNVINFAAESHVDRSILGSEIFFRTNVIGTNVLLEISRQYEVEKFIQISTMKFMVVSVKMVLLQKPRPFLPIVLMQLVKHQQT